MQRIIHISFINLRQIADVARVFIELAVLNSEEIGLQIAPIINKRWDSAYKTLLNKKDPLDERILQLAKNGELKIGVVRVKEGDKHSFEDYSHKSLPHLGKHTS